MGFFEVVIIVVVVISVDLYSIFGGRCMVYMWGN